MTEHDKSEPAAEHDAELTQAGEPAIDDEDIATLLEQTQASSSQQSEPDSVSQQNQPSETDPLPGEPQPEADVEPALASGQSDEIVWPLPDFSDAEHEQQEPVSNAFGLKPAWFEQPEPEPEPEIEFEPMTIEELEALRQSAYEEGYAEGKQQGHEAGLLSGHEEGLAKGIEQGQQQGLAEGLAQGQQQIDELSARWSGLVGQLHQPKSQLDEEVEQQVVDLAMKLAAEIVQVELQINPEIIVKTVKQALAALPLNKQETRIYLHPLDLALIEQVFPAETQQKKAWQLLADGSLAQGDCLIENDLSSVTVEMSEVIKQSLRSFVRQNGQADDTDPTA